MPVHAREQIRRLLRDEHNDNTALALALITGLQAEKDCLGYLFGIAVFHPERSTANQALKMVREHGPETMAQQALKLREGASYYYNEEQFFEKYANAGFDLFDFLFAAKMCHWRRLAGPSSHYFTITHQTLNLTHYPGETLPESAAQLDFVRFLMLPANKHFNLNASFPVLAALPLESVYFENTRVDAFPVALLSLKTLRHLQIKRGTHRPRQPMAVPDGGPYGSNSLEKLIIDSYPVRGAERLGPFPELREALLPKCALSNLHPLRESRKLEILNAKDNLLTELPAFLSDFPALRLLNLSGNPLQKIELNLEKLVQLEELDLRMQRKIFP